MCCRPWFLLLALKFSLLTAPLHAGPRAEAAFGLGTSFYSGDESKQLTPSQAYQIGFWGNLVYGGFGLINHFDLGYLAGKNFGGSYGTYSGYTGSYELGARFNFGKGTMQPYLEAGLLIGLYALGLSSPPAGKSESQTAFKYGYIAGIGFDWIKGGNRGEGPGWGLGLSYFRLYPSLGSFEFAAANLDATGIKADIRYNFGASPSR